VITQLQAAGHQSPDLIKAAYSDTDRTCFPLNGLCYVLAEALSHVCPGRFTPFRLAWEDGTSHWFLRDQDDAVIDLVSHGGPPLCTPEEYASATRARFLTHTPSKRTRTLLERAGLSIPSPHSAAKPRRRDRHANDPR
jgi:hypothetical protein